MRYALPGSFKTTSGPVVPSGDVFVYLAGTTTAASIYTASSGGTAVNSITSASDGSFTFYVDPNDYARTQKFKVVLSKTGFTTKTYDDIVIFPYAPGVYTSDYSNFNDAVTDAIGKTLIIDSSVSLPSGAITIPATVLGVMPIAPGIISKGSATSLTINGPVVGNPMHQWLSGFAAGDVKIRQPLVLPEWWGAIDDYVTATNTGTDCLLACQSASKSYVTGSSSRHIHFPGNKYRLSGEWVLDSAVAYEISGEVFPFTYIDSAGTVLTWNPVSGSHRGINASGTRFYIHDLGLKAQNIAYTSVGIDVSNVTDSIIKNVSVRYFGGKGINGQPGVNWQISIQLENVELRENGSYGCLIERSNIFSALNCTMDNNGMENLRVDGLTSGALSRVVNIKGGDYSQSFGIGGDKPGILLVYIQSFLIQGVYIEQGGTNPTANLLEIKGNATGYTAGGKIEGCHFAMAATATGHPIYLSKSKDIIIDGNTISHPNQSPTVRPPLFTTDDCRNITWGRNTMYENKYPDFQLAENIDVSWLKYKTYMFYYNDVPANQANLSCFTVGGNVTAYMMLHKSWLVGIAVRATQATTAGTITCKTTISNGITVVINTGQAGQVTTQNPFRTNSGTEQAIGLSSTLGVQIDSSADLSPTTIDVVVEVTMAEELWST